MDVQENEVCNFLDRLSEIKGTKNFSFYPQAKTIVNF